MAEVTSGELTVIILDHVETEALANLLEVSDHEDNILRGCHDALDELTNALVGAA